MRIAALTACVTIPAVTVTFARVKNHNLIRGALLYDRCRVANGDLWSRRRSVAIARDDHERSSRLMVGGCPRDIPITRGATKDEKPGKQQTR